MTDIDVKKIRELKGISQTELSIKMGVSLRTIQNWESGKVIPETKHAMLRILLSAPDLEDKKDVYVELLERKRNLIPLYEDVSTIGGTNQTAGIEATYSSSVLIDAGGWFNGGTAAIRHYGDSMIEYESGCTLVIRELKDKTEIIWGRNYVIETDEMRITKKIASLDELHIMCYSTNYDTYPDGTLIHQPVKIVKEKIRYLSRVLGSVNKEESTGKVSLIEL